MISRVCIMLAACSALAAVDVPAAVVRLAQPPLVDGVATDWNSIKAEQDIRTATGSVARFKLGWDDSSLYALFQVIDDSPLKNGATVLQELFKGGDAVGICIGTPGVQGSEQRLLAGLFADRPTVLAMRPRWPDTSKPYRYFTTASGTLDMDWVGALEGSKVAAKTSKEGYTLELAVPWTALRLAPKAGLELAFDAQLILSDPSGTANAATAWWRSIGGDAASIWDIVAEARLHSEQWGKARLVTSDPGARQDAAGAPSPAPAVAGGTPIRWELPRPAQVSLVIMDERGWIVAEPIRCTPYPAGSHEFLWSGRDRLNLPLPAGRYRYLIGYFDGIRTSFVASVGNSGRPSFRTSDGLGSIGGAHGGIGAVAADATGIYMGQVGEEGQPCLRKIDPLDGKARWFTSIGAFSGVHALAADGRSVWALIVGSYRKKVKILRLDAATGRPRAYGGVSGGTAEFLLEGRNYDALALVDGKLYLSEPGKNRLLVIDANGGKALPDIAIPAPSGLCRLDDRTLLVGSGGSVLRLDLVSGTSKPLVEGLSAVRALCPDGPSGFYVSDLGPSQQIRRYVLAADGSAAANGVFGSAGGRPNRVPVWDPLQFRNITHLALGPDGNLWCAERWDAPRRFITLSRDGRHLKDTYGAVGFGCVGIDLDDPGTIFYQTSQWAPNYVEAKVDYAQYAKDPGQPDKAWRIAAIHYLSQDGEGDTAAPDLVRKGMGSGYGRVLVFTGANGVRYLWRDGALFRWDAGRWICAAWAGASGGDGKEVTSWSDRNGDGLAQDDECSRERFPGNRWTWIDRDLTLRGGYGDLKPASIDARGVPQYAGGAYAPVWKDDRPTAFYFDQENYGIRFSPPAADGGRWIVTNAGPEQGRNFWDRASETRLARLGPDGRVQFVIGNHDGRLPKDGDNQMLMNLTGELDGVLLASEIESCFTAYTNDGLTLGWINRDEKGRIASAGPTAVYMENVAQGMLYRHPQTGRRWLAFLSTEDARVVDIDGIWGDQITRLRGDVVLASARPRGTETSGRASIPASTWVHTAGSRYQGVNGYDFEWDPAVPGLPIRDRGAMVGEIRLRRDAGALCVMAEVCDPAAWAALPAEGGDPGKGFGTFPAVEVLLGPAAPDRDAPAAGDVRIVLSASRGSDGRMAGFALACRPTSGPRLAPIAGAKVAVRQRFDRSGWRLEAEIPLALVPELTGKRSIEIRRMKKSKETKELPDLVGPFRCNAAIWLADGRRIAWIPDGFIGTDPSAMIPRNWGIANPQP